MRPVSRFFPAEAADETAVAGPDLTAVIARDRGASPARRTRIEDACRRLGGAACCRTRRSVPRGAQAEGAACMSDGTGRWHLLRPWRQRWPAGWRAARALDPAPSLRITAGPCPTRPKTPLPPAPPGATSTAAAMARPLRPSQQGYLDEDLAKLSPGPVDWDVNPERRPLDLAALFGGRDSWLEIGFGGGEHMVHQGGCQPGCRHHRLRALHQRRRDAARQDPHRRGGEHRGCIPGTRATSSTCCRRPASPAPSCSTRTPGPRSATTGAASSRRSISNRWQG